MNTEHDKAESVVPVSPDVLAHCQRIAAGGVTAARSGEVARSGDVVPGGTKYAAQGAAFDVSIEVLELGGQIEAPAGTSGEEVGAILEGTFTICAADERYRLSAGEGIIIPPGEPRIWVCTSNRGVLYRAVTRIAVGAQAETTAQQS